MKNLNISCLPYHIDNLANILYDLDFKFKVIAITEIRLTVKKNLPKKALLIYQITVENRH